jgi:hypothetical protein
MKRVQRTHRRTSHIYTKGRTRFRDGRKRFKLKVHMIAALQILRNCLQGLLEDIASLGHLLLADGKRRNEPQDVKD